MVQMARTYEEAMTGAQEGGELEYVVRRWDGLKLEDLEVKLNDGARHGYQFVGMWDAATAKVLVFSRTKKPKALLG